MLARSMAGAAGGAAGAPSWTVPCSCYVPLSAGVTGPPLSDDWM